MLDLGPPYSRPLRKRELSRRYSGKGARPSKKLCGMDSKNSSKEARPMNTLSQSGATTSFLSASTRSKPPPHTTMSSNAGLLRTSVTSLPAPPEILSFDVCRNAPLKTAHKVLFCV
jgi:hypothetical protein